MAQSKATKSRKFPLTLHATGQWCKRIRGKLYYFGSNKEAAYERHLREAADLYAGKPRGVSVDAGAITVKDLANRYLAHQHERLEANELTARHFLDCQTILRAFVHGIRPRVDS